MFAFLKTIHRGLVGQRQRTTASNRASRNSRPFILSALHQDCLFLSLVVFLSVVPHISGFGFYGVDWHYLGKLGASQDQSITGLFRALYDDYNRMRPLKILHIAGLYWLFGTHPLGYHLVNTVVLMLNAVLFYLGLRLMNRRRVLCLAAAALYALLPHYSTTRFWMYGFAANLSMALYFLSLYSDLRALSAQSVHLWVWKLVSFLSIAVSLLFYEIALPLFLLNPVMVEYAF